jgi:hypothetical protein
MLADGSAIINRITLQSVRVFLVSPDVVADFYKLLDEAPAITTSSTSKQSKGLLLSFSQMGAGEKLGFGVRGKKEVTLNIDGGIALKTIPETAFLLVMHICKEHQDKRNEYRDEYVRLPSVSEFCRRSGFFIGNEKLMITWLWYLGLIQIPFITREKDNRKGIEMRKLCNVRFVYRDNETGNLGNGIAKPTEKKGTLEQVWVRLDDKLIDSITAPPTEYGFVRIQDDAIYIVSTLNNLITKKLFAFVYGNGKTWSNNENNLITALGLENEVAKQGRGKTRKKIAAAFDELSAHGFVSKWSQSTGAKGQVVYTWTRKQYGAKAQDADRREGPQQAELDFTGGEMG